MKQAPSLISRTNKNRAHLFPTDFSRYVRWRQHELFELHGAKTLIQKLTLFRAYIMEDV